MRHRPLSLLVGSSLALTVIGSAHAKTADGAVCARALPVIGENIVITRNGAIARVAAPGTGDGWNALQTRSDWQEPAGSVESGPDSETGGTLGEREIEFSADTINYDSDAQIVTASGHVVLMRTEQSLIADKVIWNRSTGDVQAIGNVQIIDQDGNTLYGDDVMLTDSIRDGVIDNILLVLNEGGRLVARRGTRKDGYITLESAAYSPCAVETPTGKPKNPSWQIRAVKVVYDPNDKRVRYTGARLELFGLPLIPLPGLSHPVGETAGSGLLVPDIRFSAANGVQFEQPYYFNLSPNRDLTLTASVFTEVMPMVSAKYRTLTSNGAYQVTAYATSSSRIPAGATNSIGAEKDFRAYFESGGEFHLDPNWTLSGLLRVTTDRTFLRRYDISREDRLRSNVQAERIGTNSYFSLAGWATQTLRVNDPQGQVPVALPVVDWRMRLADPVAGGTVEVQLNTLAIGRTNGQDTQRGFASARWDLRKLTGWGQLLTLTATARGDVYNSSENALTSTFIYRGQSGLQARATASLAADLKWPLTGPLFGGTQVLTPRVQIVATPRVDNLEFPNEDSRAIELEDGNLFSLNRLPGYDRIEDGVRIVYGVQWSLRRPGLSIDTVIGQSYRFAGNNSFLTNGTGFSQQVSDIVGRTDVRFRNFVKFTHRYRLDKDTLAVRRNEVDATIGSKGNYVQIGYLRLNRDIGPEIEDLQDREELRLGGRVQFTRYWSAFGSGIIDLSSVAEDPNALGDGFDPIRTRLGIAYEDDCLELGFTWRRDYIATGDAQRGNTFLLRVALRNLGF